MRFSSWLRPLTARLNRNGPGRVPQRARARLRVEALEDRTTPSAVQLTNLSFVGGPNHMTPVGSTLYFEADDGIHGNQLWRTDGRPGDAARVDSGSQPVDTGGQFDTGPQRTQVGSWVYFFSDNSDGTFTLWRNDSAASPTGGISPSEAVLRNIAADPGGAGPYYLTAVGNDVYFGSYSYTDQAWELWKVPGANAPSGNIPVPVPFLAPNPDPNEPQLDANGPYHLWGAGSRPKRSVFPQP
jgi:hypothetical protein